MPPTYTQRITAFNGAYDAVTMIYSVTGIFIAHDVLAGQAGMNDVLNHRGVGDWSAGDWAVPHNTLPLYRDVAHFGTNVFGTNFFQTVRGYPTVRQAFNTTTDATMEVTVTMEGRVLGVHDIAPRVQMTSEILFQSLRAGPAPATTFVGLGLDFQGVPRDVPMEVYSVSQCLTLASVDAAIANANLIAGSVNEGNWTAPWQSGVAVEPEGDYLYLGPTRTTVDRNTRTAMVIHEFARLQSRNKQHIFEWFEYTEHWDDVTKRRVRVYDKKVYSGFVQKVAGTDLWWDDATPIPNFATLGLNAILF